MQTPAPAIANMMQIWTAQTQSTSKHTYTLATHTDTRTSKRRVGWMQQIAVNAQRQQVRVLTGKLSRLQHTM